MPWSERRRAFRSFAVLLLLLGAQPAVAQPRRFSSSPDPPPLHRHRADELLVRFRANARVSDRAALRARVGGQVLRDLGFIHAERLRIRGVGVSDAIERLRRHPLVEYAEPNYVWKALLVPNDPQFPQMYSLRNTGQTGGTPGADIRATQAWDLFTGNPELKVGVIDTGVDYNHPDLAANMWTNPGEVPANGLDDDHNGYVDDVHGYDFANDDGDPFDDFNHGTHVAGTIAAVGNNGVGVTGVNWRARIVALKFLNVNGEGTTEGAIAAIAYAVAVGARVTNNSWGGFPFSQALLDAINAAGAAGQLFVAAAGNSRGDNDLNPIYPASFDSPFIVAVASTDHNDLLSTFSCFGATSVDLGAPGTRIITPSAGGGYVTVSGTSLASPQVAGALAFVLGRFPDMSAMQAKDQVLGTVDPLPSLAGKTLTGGRLNLFAAAQATDGVPPGTIADLAAVEPGSSTMGLSWTATGDDGQAGRASRYEIRYSQAPITETDFGSLPLAPGPTPQPAGSVERAEVRGLDFNTTYFFAIKALDEFGQAGPISNVATGTTLGVPDVAWSPTSFSQALLAGASATQSLTIRNEGQGTLDFAVPDTTTAWLGVSPRSGRVHAGQDTQLTVRFDALGLAAGGHGAEVRVQTNDPDESSVSIPVQLQVVSAPHITVSPVSLDFGTVFSGSVTARTLTVSNLGTEELVVSGIASGDPAVTATPASFTLAVTGTQAVLVTYTPNAPGTLADSLTIAGNDPDAPTVKVALRGAAIPEPDVLIAPESLSVALTIPDSTMRTLTIRNTGGSPLTWSAAVRGAPGSPVGWLSIHPTQGTIPPGEAAPVEVHFDAAGLLGGHYDAELRVSSNDPDEPEAVVPAHLHAIGIPDIAFEPPLPEDLIDFGSLFTGLCVQDSVRVRNQGTDSLRVSIESTHPAFTVSPSSFVLWVGQSRMVVVTYCPPDVGLHHGTIAFRSNDPDTPAAYVTVLGRGLDPPDIATFPEQVVASVPIPATETRTVTVRNQGGNDLVLNIATASDSSAAAFETASASGAADPPGVLGHGGPDLFGYRWWDAAEPGGPVFAWVDIARPENVVPITGQDALSAPISMGMSFPFYGAPFSQVRVSTNGFLTFSSCCPVPGNVRLPSASAPASLIAPFWDALSFSGFSIYARFDGTRFIVSWHGARHRGTPGGPYTFQVVLHPNGTIVYQYLSMTPTVSEATVGIQNAARNDGLTVVHNASYVQNGLAVMLVPPLPFLSVRPASGVIPPGGSLDLTLEFRTLGLEPGILRDTVKIASNDPDESTVSVPVVLNAGLEPDIASNPAAVDFGTVYLGQTGERTLEVRNAGLGVLEFTGASVTGSGFGLASAAVPALLGPGESVPLVVRFAPSSVCSVCTGELRLQSSDPDENPLTVPLSGTGLPPPDISVSLDTLRAAGATTLGPLALLQTKPLLVSNTGDSDLQFQVPVSRDGSAPVQSSAGWISADPAAGTIPAGSSMVLVVAFDAAGLPDGDHVGSLVISSNDPDEPAVEVPCRFHVGVAGATFQLDPGSLMPHSQGRWISADLEPGPALDPHAIVLSSVRLQRSAPVATDGPISYHDDDQDGFPQVRYKFDRASLIDVLGEGDPVAIEVIGEVEDVTWFQGVDLVRVPTGAKRRPAAEGTDGVREAEAIPAEFGLRLAGPSPRRGSAALELAIPTRSAVDLRVFDVHGRFVSELAHRELDPGWHRLAWEGTTGSGALAPPGIYFARLIAGDRAFRVRIALLR